MSISIAQESPFHKHRYSISLFIQEIQQG